MKELNSNVDILLICETKLDLSFPRAQFHIHGFGQPYRFDKNGKAGGILLYTRDDVPLKPIESLYDYRGFFVEITCEKRNDFYTVLIAKKKYLIFDHVMEIDNNLDLLSSKL